jgi:hypothetical protein
MGDGRVDLVYESSIVDYSPQDVTQRFEVWNARIRVFVGTDSPAQHRIILGTFS